MEDRSTIELEIFKLKKSIEKGTIIGEVELNKSLERYDLDSSKIENVEVEYLIDNCVIKGETTMLVAPPGQGKSSFAIASAVYCLKNQSINNLLYLDLDNSLVTLSDRKINRLKDEYKTQFKYLHSSSASKIEMLHILKILSKSSLKSYLIP